MLVIIGADEWGNKDVLGLACGFRAFRQHPARDFGVSGHLRVVAAPAWFLMSGSLAFVNFFGGAARPSHRMTVEFVAMGVVDEAVEDRIGKGGFVDHGVPCCDRQLAGDQD